MKTFFFYDLETSGFNPREDRIMQFAGQRTDINLNKIGEPINILIKLNDDVLPSPNALMVTKISPQKTVEEGYTEAEFAKMAFNDFFTPDTIAVGYNSVRFDDEHMRYLFWRNFYDAYVWQWKDNRSKWDLLDVVRMVRALRPEGINWPFIENDKGEKIAANKLELLTKENGIRHENAHDAMSDVDGLIDVARLLKEKQPKMFDYLLKMRSKNEIKNLVNLENPAPFVYSSGRYSAEFEKTTVAFPVASAPNKNVLVWDLRVSPEEFVDWNEDEIFANITASAEEYAKADFKKIPVKILNYGKCPSVAPFGVLTEENKSRLRIVDSDIRKNIETLSKNPHLSENLRSAFERRADFYSEGRQENNDSQPEARLYDGFINDNDRAKIMQIQNKTTKDLADFHPEFTDERLDDLLIHYKARSFPRSLNSSEKESWLKYRRDNLQKMLPRFLAEIEEVSKRKLSKDQEFVFEELKLWLDNVMEE